MDWECILKIMEEEARKRRAPALVLKKDRDPFKILVSAILSTRTRDENTTKAVERLFSRVKGIKDLRRISEEEIAELIKDVGFYRNKAKILKRLAESIEEIPKTLEELLKLPGVGRKVANIVLYRSIWCRYDRR